jgi:hypothetical protein
VEIVKEFPPSKNFDRLVVKAGSQFTTSTKQRTSLSCQEVDVDESTHYAAVFARINSNVAPPGRKALGR